MTGDLEHRFTYHPPGSREVVSAHERVRAGCLALARTLDATLPRSREKALALTNLEQALMWANASIARTQLVDPLVTPSNGD